MIREKTRRLVRRPGTPTKTAVLPRVQAAGPTADLVWAQSLADGALGHVLGDVELALAGELRWDHVVAELDGLSQAEPDVSPAASLFYGAPAISFVMDAATANGYQHAPELQEQLDLDLEGLVRGRLDAIRVRKEAGAPLSTDEYGLLHGLLGLGVVLLRRAHASPALSALLDDVLAHVVGLTRPRSLHGLRVPSWYVQHGPTPGVSTPGGHINNTMPDGAAGLLAFLALCAHAGHQVDDHQDAISSLLGWFTLTRQDGPDGPWWPAWVTPDQLLDLQACRPLAVEVPPPSWAGLAGMARAVQMGATILGEGDIMKLAEATIAACLTPRQMRRLTSVGLQHGLAGLYQIGRRAADGSISLTKRIGAAGDLLRDLEATHGAADTLDGGFLNGTAGLRLAAQTLRRVNGPASVWDTSLVIA